MSGESTKTRLPRPCAHLIVGRVRLTREEIDALVRVLDYYIPDLHAEILRSEHGAWRDQMRAQEARLVDLRQRLLTERSTGRSKDQEVRQQY